MNLFKAISVASVICFSGCQYDDRPFTDNSQDSELYAQTQRRITLMTVERARGGDRATQMAKIVEEFSHRDRPFGEYRDIFLQIHDVANEALEICRATDEGKKASIDVQLDKLVELASELPTTADVTKNVVQDK